MRCSDHCGFDEIRLQRQLVHLSREKLWPVHELRKRSLRSIWTNMQRLETIPTVPEVRKCSRHCVGEYGESLEEIGEEFRSIVTYFLTTIQELCYQCVLNGGILDSDGCDHQGVDHERVASS